MFYCRLIFLFQFLHLHWLLIKCTQWLVSVMLPLVYVIMHIHIHILYQNRYRYRYQKQPPSCTVCALLFYLTSLNLNCVYNCTLPMRWTSSEHPSINHVVCSQLGVAREYKINMRVFVYFSCGIKIVDLLRLRVQNFFQIDRSIDSNDSNEFVSFSNTSACVIVIRYCRSLFYIAIQDTWYALTHIIMYKFLLKRRISFIPHAIQRDETQHHCLFKQKAIQDTWYALTLKSLKRIISLTRTFFNFKIRHRMQSSAMKNLVMDLFLTYMITSQQLLQQTSNTSLLLYHKLIWQKANID